MSSRTPSISEDSSSPVFVSNDTSPSLESEDCEMEETLVRLEDEGDPDGFKKSLETLKKVLKIKDSSSESNISDEVFEPFVVKVIPGTKEYQDKGTYKLRPGLKRGKAMIVNFETFEGTGYERREGSEIDVLNMHALLCQLGIKTYPAIRLPTSINNL